MAMRSITRFSLALILFGFKEESGERLAHHLHHFLQVAGAVDCQTAPRNLGKLAPYLLVEGYP